MKEWILKSLGSNFLNLKQIMTLLPERCRADILVTNKNIRDSLNLTCFISFQYSFHSLLQFYRIFTKWLPEINKYTHYYSISSLFTAFIFPIKFGHGVKSCRNKDTFQKSFDLHFLTITSVMGQKKP